MKGSFYFLCVLIMLLSSFLVAQTITGKLVDQTGKGLSGLQLKLYISPKTYDATSATDGTFTFTNITEVKKVEELPTGYSVSDNYPNPFNPKTRIEITLPNSGSIQVGVYNLVGQKVIEDVERYFSAGKNSVDLELDGLPNGLYLARITLDGKYPVTKKLLLLYGSQHLSSSSSNNISFSRLKKSTTSYASTLDTRIDSIVVTGSAIAKKVFANLPTMVGSSLNLGNLIITLPAPSVPTLVYPENSAVDISITPTLYWYVKDGNSTSYTLQLSTNNTFSSFVYNQSGLKNASQAVTGLSNLTKYYWRVNATNIYGTSDYSSPWSFTTLGTVPTAPILLTPANTAIEIVTSPKLTWNASAGATSYTLQVSANNSFSSYIYNQSGLTNFSQVITGLSNLTKYYWRVSATNGYGTSDWSSVWSFTTIEIPPNVPTLSSPVDGIIDVSLSPILYWNVSGTATSYTLQVSTSSSFTSYVFNQSGLTNTNKQISGLTNFTKYYWRVNATKNNSASEWSNTWSFIAIGTTPQAPTLTSPTNTATSISTTPALIWNASNNATSYTLQVSTSSSFASFVYNQSGLTSTSQQVTGLNNSMQYYWRVNATNNYGTSTWSSIWSFITLITVPQAPILSSPLDGALDVSVSPTLYWNVSSAATSYSLQVSTNKDFSTLLINQSGLLNTNQPISGLLNSNTYYWRVSASNSYGNSSWSNYWSFKIISTPCPLTVVYSGKVYNTVKIGRQCWFKENLNIGTMINGNQNQTNNGKVEKYCYNNDTTNCATYGGLFQWAEAVQYQDGATNKSSPNPAFTGNVKGLCPEGWHIPSIAEFQTLATEVSSNGNTLKAVGQGTGNGIGTNTSGFSALITGYRTAEIFRYFTFRTFFQSSSELITAPFATDYLYLDGASSGVGFNNGLKEDGFSVRCLKD